MAKREYILREEALLHPFANGKYDHKNADINFILGHESYKEWLEAFHVFTEQEIVKPYLTKLRAKIISSIEDIKGTYDNTTPKHDRPLCKCARNEVRLEIIDMIDNILSEQETWI